MWYSICKVVEKFKKKGEINMREEDKIIIEHTMEGLIITAFEKVLVLGVDEATDSVFEIRDMIEDLQMFWDLEENWVLKLEDTLSQVGFPDLDKGGG